MHRRTKSQIAPHPVPMKAVNSISISVLVLLVGLNAILLHTGIIHWVIAFIAFILTLLLAASIKIADQWEKAVILRSGNRNFGKICSCQPSIPE